MRIDVAAFSQLGEFALHRRSVPISTRWRRRTGRRILWRRFCRSNWSRAPRFGVPQLVVTVAHPNGVGVRLTPENRPTSVPAQAGSGFAGHEQTVCTSLVGGASSRLISSTMALSI